MNLDKQRLGHNFSRQAAHYDHYATVQHRLAARLVHSLKEQGQNFSRILEIGCGTGYLTGLLRPAFPQARIIALDLAPAAVQAARRRLAAADGIEWLVADGEQPPPGRFDLIVASSVFQWFSQPRQACQLYWQHLNPGGLLAFSTLGPATFRELAASLRQAGTIFPEKPPPRIPAENFIPERLWKEFLNQAGFAGISVRHEFQIQEYPDPWAFLRAVRGMGATSTRPVYLPRKLLAAALAHYDAAFRRNGAIQVTYEVIWAKGVKGMSQLRDDVS